MRRTPRRRISPRTKLRCRAIKNFLRRALGSSSQPDLQINSTLSVSVSDLKNKIVGIERQLNKVSKHCQDLACLEYNLRPGTISSVTTEVHNNVEPVKQATKSISEVETKVLYNPSQDRYGLPTKRESTSKVILCNHGDGTKVPSLMSDQNYSCKYKENKRSKHDRLDPIQESEQNLRNWKNYSIPEKSPNICPRSSFHSANKPQIDNRHLGACSQIYRQKKRNRNGYVETSNRLTKESNEPLLEQRCGDQRKHHKMKYESSELDQDFIADIIRRQYRPVKLFGRRESDFSQFSAPVCRDQEFSVGDSVLEGSDLCSCCHKEHRHQRHSRYMCSNDLSDIRSICDTRLYSSRKHKHHTSRKKRLEDYNDSAMYDIVPVKEKTSPKSRRRFVEDNISMYDKYKEVPPSPRTLRPRLNLQAQFHTDEDEELPLTNKQLRPRMKSPVKNGNNSNISSEVFIHNRNKRGVQKSQIPNTPKPYSQGVGTMSSLQYPNYINEPTTLNNDTTLNTQTTDMTGDKTDKTLSEIKDILQSFLLEIKKESSQSDKLNNRSNSQSISDQQTKTANVPPNTGGSFNNNNNFAQCNTLSPFIPPFTNPCCYPILPLCPMNCMRNGFVVPSPSFTCATCVNNSKEQTCGTNDSKNKIKCPGTTNSETEKLIKEIHKFISQNPKSVHKKKSYDVNSPRVQNNHYLEKNTLTSRSVGDSTKASKHDAKVGTPKMKCYSKSCEAIGSRETADTRGSYSDTILEKGSGEETTTAQSTSETDYSSELTIIDKKKGGKFTKILRSIGLLKRNNNNTNGEIGESDSSLEVNKTKSRPPFQQHIMNYNMHRQEYFHPPPPMSTYPHHVAHHQQYEYCNHPLYHDPRNCFSPTSRQNKAKDSTARHSHEHDIRMHCKSPRHMPISPYANYYDPRYGNVSPQVPLCLKEIEVKSIGTQSVRKMSFLQKFTNKMQVPSLQTKEPSRKQSSTQTAKDKPGKNLFDWKKLQAKAMQNHSDPLNFSYKTQKRLADGDIKMRKAMLKKLFYKRNPFSPRNLLIRTLLGKDRSSFGEPPKMYKPSMFL